MVAWTNSIESFLFAATGNIQLLALVLIMFFLFILVWRGLDFRYALMVLAPGIVSLARAGWIPTWIEGFMWFFVVGYGLFLGWRSLNLNNG